LGVTVSLIFLAVLSQNTFADDEPQELRGYLNTLITDYFNGTSTEEYILFVDEGKDWPTSYKLEFETVPSSIRELSGKNVIVVGKLLSKQTVSPPFVSQNSISVTSIDSEQQTMEGAEPDLPVPSPLKTATPLLEYPSDLNGVCCNATYFENKFYNASISLANYWGNHSYGALQVEGQVIDWQLLPKDEHEYSAVGDMIDFGMNTIVDAVILADPFVDFDGDDNIIQNSSPDNLRITGDNGDDIDSMLLIFSEGVARCFCAFALADPLQISTDEGTLYVFSVWIPGDGPNGFAYEETFWEGYGVTVHEMGHNFGLDHNSEYSIMEGVAGGLGGPPGLIAPQKDRFGWILPEDILTVPQGQYMNFTLDILSGLSPTSNYLMAKIPFSVDEYHSVEARTDSLFDNIPANGHIALINEVGELVCKQGCLESPLGIGGSFFDLENNIEIIALSNTDTSINVTGGRSPHVPTALNDTTVTDEDTQIVIDVLFNDTDPDGDLLTIDSATTPPLNGSTVINANQTITYMPNLNFFGVDSFDYKSKDDFGWNDIATVTVTVNPIDDPPAADDQSVLTKRDTLIEITLTGSDPDDTPILNFTIVDNPINGTLGTLIQIPPTSANVTYAPDAGFMGFDSFTFNVNNGTYVSTSGTVTVNVNDPPIAVDDTATTQEETATTIDVLQNDSDPDGDPFTVFSVDTTGTIGSVINNINNVTYTPPLDFFGIDIFSYTAIDDDDGISNSATVTVNVTNVNDPPVAVDDAANAPEDTPIIIDVLQNDTDADDDTLIVSFVNTTGTLGSVVNNTNNVTYTPPPEFSGVDSFSYVAFDGIVTSNSAIVTVTVSSNESPIAVDDTTNTPQDTPITIDVLQNDSDPDGDPLTISFVNTTGTIGSVINNTNTITYTPQAGFLGIDTFTYTISDGEEQSNPAIVTVTIFPTNALTVCEAGCNFTAIQAAINAASDGDEVKIMDSRDYNENVVANVTALTLTKAPVTTPTIWYDGNSHTLTISANDITISDLEIKYNGTSSGFNVIRINSVSGAKINNNQISNTKTINDGNGIHLESVDDSSVIGNIISTDGTGGNNNGVYVRGDRNLIHNNNITTNGGGSSNRGIFLQDDADFNTISNNTISTAGRVANYGIQLRLGSNNNLISDNIISTIGGSGTNSDGINLSPDGDPSNYNVIENNIIQSIGGTTSKGIDIWGGNNNVTNNTILDGRSGIRIQDDFNVISDNNIVLSSENYGIEIITADSNSFYRNNVTITGIGVWIFQGANNTFYDDKINSTGNDVLLDGIDADHDNYFVSVDFGNDISANSDVATKLFVQHRLDILVLDNLLNPILDAIVIGNDATPTSDLENPTSSFSATTNSSGLIPTQVLTDFMANGTFNLGNYLNFNNYTITASKFEVNATTSLNHTADKQITLILDSGPELFCGKTIFGFDDFINGTNNDDTLIGNSGDDLIIGLSGNDRIRGNEGDDCIFGGDGDDRILGNLGFDFLFGENGNDKISGGPDDDLINGGDGFDICHGGIGNNTIQECEVLRFFANVTAIFDNGTKITSP